MTTYAIRDAGGVRRFRTYESREAAEREIERIEGPGCRAPFSVVEVAARGWKVSPAKRAGVRS